MFSGLNLSKNITSLNSNISFCGKVDLFSKKIPYRLSSKFQDTFHSTSQQSLTRMFLDLREQNLSLEEIACKFFNVSLEEIQCDDKYLAKVKEIEEIIKKIDLSFSKILPLTFPKTFFRGVMGENQCTNIINAAKVGDIIQPDIGYSFLTSKMKYAEKFASHLDGSADGPEKSVVMILRLPSGALVSRDIGSGVLFGDKNIVLARGAKFEVLDKTVKNNRTYITLKYLNCALDKKD